MTKSVYEIILYYKYTPVLDTMGLLWWHRFTCMRLGLKGRIIIAKEGINGTLEGVKENVNEYCRLLSLFDKKSTFGDFHDVIFKRSEGTGKSFPKLRVKVRDEIVSAHLGEDDVNPTEITGKRLSPEELRIWFEEQRDFYIVDMRNDYEYISGHFKGSINSNMQNFRELPEVAKKIDHLKIKRVITVCTGGVRCEKASGYLIKKGFKDVYQLDGGIVKYMERYPGEDFLGSLYVFDNRITLDFDEKVKQKEVKGKKHEIIGMCVGCGKKSERYVNCMNLDCHIHFICCEDCDQYLNGTGDKVVCPRGCEAGVEDKKKQKALAR